MGSKVRTVLPAAVDIQGVRQVARTVHHDARGFLVETLRQDDREVGGGEFAMSYLSLTRPGEKRDAERWHIHTRQTDRFVVILGEMILALYDARPESPTHRRLAVARILGARSSWASGERPTGEEASTPLLTIPAGVLHAIGNLSQEPFLLQNYPTRLYDPADEGRIAFAGVPIPDLGNAGFSWERVEVVRA